MTNTRKYSIIQDFIRQRIQKGEYTVGTFLPSEHEFCSTFSTTRTTVRKALDELVKEGYIEKVHGKGSQVLERSKTLGLLTVKGFSESANFKIKTKVLQEPKICEWDSSISFTLNEKEKKSKCVYFQRVRYINNQPIMLEHNWYALNALNIIHSKDFVKGSFFKTLSQKYLIEILGSEQELRSEKANLEIAHNLGLEENDPILHISIRYKTSLKELNLYSEVYCNTNEFPIRNSYFV